MAAWPHGRMAAWPHGRMAAQFDWRKNHAATCVGIANIANSRQATLHETDGFLPMGVGEVHRDGLSKAERPQTIFYFLKNALHCPACSNHYH